MKINFEIKQIRKFGIALGGVLIIFALWNFYKQRDIWGIILSICSMTSTFLALFFHDAIRPIYFVFMKLAFLLGWINTKIILSIIFYIIISPIGLFMKMYGRDKLEKKIDLDKKSYWNQRKNSKFDNASYEKQY
jgi:hypothetical protein